MLPLQTFKGNSLLPCWSVIGEKIWAYPISHSELEWSQLQSICNWVRHPYTQSGSYKDIDASILYCGSGTPMINYIISIAKSRLGTYYRPDLPAHCCIRALEESSSASLRLTVNKIAESLKSDSLHPNRFEHNAALGHPLYLMLISPGIYEQLKVEKDVAKGILRELPTEYLPQTTEADKMSPLQTSRAEEPCWSVEGERIFGYPISHSELGFSQLQSIYRWVWHPYTQPHSYKDIDISAHHGSRDTPIINEIISTAKSHSAGIHCRPHLPAHRCLKALKESCPTLVRLTVNQIIESLKADLLHTNRFEYNTALGHPLYLMLTSPGVYEQLEIEKDVAEGILRQLPKDYLPQTTEADKMSPLQTSRAEEPCWSVGAKRIFAYPISHSELGFSELQSIYRWVWHPYTQPHSYKDIDISAHYGSRDTPIIDDIISTAKSHSAGIHCRPHLPAHRCLSALKESCPTLVQLTVNQIIKSLEADLLHPNRFEYNTALGHPLYLMLISPGVYEQLEIEKDVAEGILRQLPKDYLPQTTEQVSKKQRTTGPE